MQSSDFLHNLGITVLPLTDFFLNGRLSACSFFSVPAIPRAACTAHTAVNAHTKHRLHLVPLT